MGFRIKDRGFRIKDRGFRIQDQGFRIEEPLAELSALALGAYRGTSSANLCGLRGDRSSAKSSTAEDAEVRRGRTPMGPLDLSAGFCKSIRGFRIQAGD